MSSIKHNKNYVFKRDGRKEEVHLDKITSRIKKLCYNLNMDYVDPFAIASKVANGLYTGVTTVELDTQAADIAARMNTVHPDYAVLAARIAISNLHKETKKHFSEVMADLHNTITDDKSRTLSTTHYNVIISNANRLNSCIIYDRDFYYDYFAFKTLERLYLSRINGKIIERPQHFLMRLSIGIHGEDIDAAIETYNILSEHYYIHGSTTLFSAATPQSQMISAFTLSMPEDSLAGIYDCIGRCGLIAETDAGVGVNLQNIRAKGTYIAGTNGVSNGLVPMLRVFDAMTIYSHQSQYQTNGLVTIYLEPWHSDIFEYLLLKKPFGKAEYRATNLNYAIYIPDLFMKRVTEDSRWCLMCPHKSPGLVDSFGDEFVELYEKYEKEGRFVREMKARDLWRAICVAQLEYGSPYIVYKDACNRKSNQMNLGTIRGTSACTELVQYTSADEIGSAPTASIVLERFVSANRTFDFHELRRVVHVITKNLNKIIDNNQYPLDKAETSALRHRPLAIGVQGLADAFIRLRLPFDSNEARVLNIQLFETIYYAALEASCELAEKYGPYSSYDGSPISKGVLQYDLWGVTPTTLWDWAVLKEKIANNGVRNSLLIALVPTALTSQIMGVNVNVAPYSSLVSRKRVLDKEYDVVNRHLLKDLTRKGIWNESLKNKLLLNEGSVQKIEEIPDDIKIIYKTAWDMSQKVIINMAADRGAFVDQSQALDIFLSNASYSTLTSMHFYGWNKGLKTGLYHLYTKIVANPALSKNTSEDNESEKNYSALVCSLQNPGACDMCGA